MIGVFGGTFDPIHYGHLRPALEVLEALGLTELRFVPLAQAVHRDQPAADADLRLAMARAAVADQPGFRVDEREIHRSGPSYTVHTLEDLRGELSADAPLCLLLGADAFNGFLTWHRPLDILGLAHLVVMGRPGAGGPADPALARLTAERHCPDARGLRSSPAGQILFQPVTQLAISATDIRARVRAGTSPRYLLPDPVFDIIRREGLYGPAGERVKG